VRILFLGINYWPEETGIAVFSTGRAEYLAARGHSVTVCTGFPYYPQWRVADEYKGRLIAHEERHGVRILRSYLFVPQRVTSFRRVLHEATFLASSLLRALGERRPELLLVTSPPLLSALSAKILCTLWQIPYVFHVADLQPDTAADLGMLSAGRLLKVLYAVERMAYQSAALISTLTESMRARIISKGIAPVKVVLFSDWSDPALFAVGQNGTGEGFRGKHNLGNKVLALHSGNMGVKQGLDVVVEAATLAREDPNLLFLLVGDGADRERLQIKAKARNLNNLLFLPLQEKAAFLDMLAAADVCLVTQKRNVADIVFPSKLITLLAAGRPVIASLNGASEVARVITESSAGVLVAPEDPLALCSAIRAMLADRGGMRVMSERGRDYAVQQWDRERVLAFMETHLFGVTHLAQPPVEPNEPSCRESS
jgi:colanic acid biosynthesis glycosyl transferase WcaI